MRILLTGHKGYIGAVAGPVLRSAGHEVVGLDTDLYSCSDFGCETPAIPEIPEISSKNCRSDGERHAMVLNEKKDGKRVIVICTDRIERVAREGAAIAVNEKDIERNA